MARRGQIRCPCSGFFARREFFDDPCGIADGEAVGGDVFNDHAAAADDDVVPDRDARHDLDAAAEPDVAAHRDGKPLFYALVTRGGVQRVIDRIKTALGRDEDIVAEGDGRAVEKDAVVVGKEIVARAQLKP